MFMAATATEVCDDTQQDCVQGHSLLASKTTVNANTPPSTDLGGLADEQGAAATEQATKSNEAMAGSKAAAQAAVDAITAADIASRASDAHDRASATSRDAAQLAAEASDARAQAIAAQEKADAAKAHLEAMTTNEAACQKTATDAVQEMKKAKVLAEVKTAAVETQKAELAKVQEKLKQATEDKKNIDDKVIALSREAEAKKEKTEAATTKEADTKAKLAAAAAKFQEAMTKFDETSADEAKTSVQFGYDQAVAVEEEEKKKIARTGRKLAQTVFDSKNALATQLEEKAIEDEESAGAAVGTAQELTEKATELAGAVPASLGRL